MQFYPVWTSYNEVGKYIYYKDWHRYYRDVLINKAYIPELEERRISSVGLFWEYEWIKAHKPYYQIWPGIADEFIRTRIDINSSLLKAPHKVFAIKLPVLENPLLSFQYNTEKKAIVQNIIVLHEDETDLRRGDRSVSWRISYLVDGMDGPGNCGIRIYLKDNKTIEECIGEFAGIISKDIENKSFIVPASIVEASLRLIVGVHFLATGSHKILEYDVLSKHLAAYRALEIDNPKRKEYEEKAKKEDKFGWNIGYGRAERGLKLPAGISYEEAIRRAGGREFLYQHMRGGHWHTVKYGVERKLEKVMWFDETVVRPDLPPKPVIN